MDENNEVVKPGNFSEKILVTVLFSRTIQLIRYELSDSVLLADDGQKCDLPFKTLVGVQGRIEEVITMDGLDGTAVRIHPNFFHNHMEAFPVKGWQIVQEPSNKSRSSSQARLEISRNLLADKILDLLVGQGVRRPEVNIE